MRHVWIEVAALWIALVAALGAAAISAASSGSIAGHVTVRKGGSPKHDRSGVVVYVEGLPPSPEPAKVHHQIRQRDLEFHPGQIAIPVGATVDFPNDDKVFHNVFSISEAARFDLGLYKSGTGKSVTFDEPGVVDVYCNIHPEMVAKIKVVDSGRFTVTGADGSFRLDRLPPGTWPLVAWQAWGEPWRGQVVVTGGGTAMVTIDLVEGDRTTRHLRKDNTPYGRYR